MSRRDNIYRHGELEGKFVFDDRVAAVFPDMIKRSVPGYSDIVTMIGQLAGEFATDDSICYDLGCSLGAATVMMRRRIRATGCRIIAIDNSAPMIERCRQALERENRRPEADSEVPVELVCDDILNVPLENASVVVLNFTLQFIPPERRAGLIGAIYRALLPGGILILSEKIRAGDNALDRLYIEMHHRFKQENGYSELEISRKRAALENVLIPETVARHRQRIRDAGFGRFALWYQCMNFASMLAVKK